MWLQEQSSCFSSQTTAPLVSSSSSAPPDPAANICICTFNVASTHSLSSLEVSKHLIRSSLMMNVSQTLETEEDLLTCLQIKLYHPLQSSSGLYTLLPLGVRGRHSAEDPLRLGRDAKACTFALVDPKVSRKQLALQAYRTPHSPDMLFTVQNLSIRGKLSVNGLSLDYLEKTELPDKALIRFGEYEILILREPGEAKSKFEVAFEVLTVPPSRETCTFVPTSSPVMDTGSCRMSVPGELREIGPLETDETIMIQ